MGSTTAAATAAGAALLAACKMDSRTEPFASEPPRGRAQPLERDIDRIVSAQRTSDGAGVRLNRALGGDAPIGSPRSAADRVTTPRTHRHEGGEGEAEAKRPGTVATAAAVGVAAGDATTARAAGRGE